MRSDVNSADADDGDTGSGPAVDSAEWSGAPQADGPADGTVVDWSWVDDWEDEDEAFLVERCRPLHPNWEVIGLAGRGGMGVVFRCRDRKLGREVAIKRVLSANRRTLRRFEIEARAVAGLGHANIIHILDYKRDQLGPYIIMEFAARGDLQARVERGGPLPEAECIEIVAAVARALGYAHTNNVLHRDIKPSNILLMSDGTPKLSDFGLVRIVGRSLMSSSSGRVGTPVYMAPEQSRDAHNIGPEADLFALGKTIYFLVTGRLPITIEREKLPRSLRNLVLRCVEYEPEDRYRTVAEFLEALDAARSQQKYGLDLGEGECPKCGLIGDREARTCGRCREPLTQVCPDPGCGQESRVWCRYCPTCAVDIPLEREIREILEAAEGHLEDRLPRNAQEEIAEALKRNGEHRAALELAARIKKVVTEVNDLDEDADALCESENYEKLQECVTQALELDREHPRFLALLGELPARIRERDARRAMESATENHQQKRPRRALEHYETALRLSPDNMEAQRGIQICRQLLSHVQAIEEAALQKEAHGEIDCALKGWELIAQLDTGHVEASRKYSDLRGRMGRAGELIVSGRHSVLEKRWAEGRGHFEKALKSWPSNRAAREGLGGCQDALAEIGAARTKLKSDQQADLAELLRTVKRVRELCPDDSGMQELESGLQERARDVEDFRALARRAEKRQGWDLAVSLLERALGADPNDESLRREHERATGILRERELERRLKGGREDLGRRRVREARLKFLEAHELDSQSAEARSGLDQCEAEIRKSDALFGAAHRLREEGELEGGLEACDKALKIESSNNQLEELRQELDATLREAKKGLRRAERAARKKRPWEAEEAYNEVLRLWPKCPSAEDQRQAAGNARTRFEQLFAEARRAKLGRQLTTCTKRLEEALSIGESPEARDLLKEVQADARKAEETVQEARKAAQNGLWRGAATSFQIALHVNAEAAPVAETTEVETEAEQVKASIERTSDLFHQGHFERAIVAAAQGLELGPDGELKDLLKKAETRARRVRELEDRVDRLEPGEPEQASLFLEELIGLQPSRPELEERKRGLGARVRKAEQKMAEADAHESSAEWDAFISTVELAAAMNPRCARTAAERVENARRALKRLARRRTLLVTSVVFAGALLMAYSGWRWVCQPWRFSRLIVSGDANFCALDWEAARKDYSEADVTARGWLSRERIESVATRSRVAERVGSFTRHILERVEEACRERDWDQFVSIWEVEQEQFEALEGEVPKDLGEVFEGWRRRLTERVGDAAYATVASAAGSDEVLALARKWQVFVKLFPEHQGDARSRLGSVCEKVQEQYAPRYAMNLEAFERALNALDLDDAWRCLGEAKSMLAQTAEVGCLWAIPDADRPGAMEVRLAVRDFGRVEERTAGLSEPAARIAEWLGYLARFPDSEHSARAQQELRAARAADYRAQFRSLVGRCGKALAAETRQAAGEALAVMDRLLAEASQSECDLMAELDEWRRDRDGLRTFFETWERVDQYRDPMLRHDLWQSLACRKYGEICTTLARERARSALAEACIAQCGVLAQEFMDALGAGEVAEAERSLARLRVLEAIPSVVGWHCNYGGGEDLSSLQDGLDALQALGQTLEAGGASELEAQVWARGLGHGFPARALEGWAELAAQQARTGACESRYRFQHRKLLQLEAADEFEGAEELLVGLRGLISDAEANGCRLDPLFSEELDRVAARICETRRFLEATTKSAACAEPEDQYQAWESFLDGFPNGWRVAEARQALVQSLDLVEAKWLVGLARTHLEEGQFHVAKDMANRVRTLVQGLVGQSRLAGEYSREAEVVCFEAQVEMVRDKLGEQFEVPSGVQDDRGNAIRLGFDADTGLPLEIRHKSTRMPFVFVPAGQVELEAETTEADPVKTVGPPQFVNLKPFYIGKYEVSVREFRTFTSTRAYRTGAEHLERECSILRGNVEGLKGDKTANWLQPGFHQDGTHPVVLVSWDDATAYVSWLGWADTVFSLPTGPQWELACRAGCAARYLWGERAERATEYANVSGSVSDEPGGGPGPAGRLDRYEYTAPVGSLRANQWGIFDLAGNVWEWTRERRGDFRVCRGGSWFFKNADASCVSRFPSLPDYSYNDVGFRCVYQIPSPPDPAP